MAVSAAYLLAGSSFSAVAGMHRSDVLMTRASITPDVSLAVSGDAVGNFDHDDVGLRRCQRVDQISQQAADRRMTGADYEAHLLDSLVPGSVDAY
jgi:hypothetical protein